MIDPDAAPIVRNIFEMRASGISPHHIADKLNEDGVPIPSDYYYAKLGKPNPRRTRHMWSPETVRQLTREMCLELIEYITLDAYVEGQPRDIYIYYKLLDEPLKDKRSLF